MSHLPLTERETLDIACRLAEVQDALEHAHEVLSNGGQDHNPIGIVGMAVRELQWCQQMFDAAALEKRRKDAAEGWL